MCSYWRLICIKVHSVSRCISFRPHIVVIRGGNSPFLAVEPLPRDKVQTLKYDYLCPMPHRNQAHQGNNNELPMLMQLRNLLESSRDYSVVFYSTVCVCFWFRTSSFTNHMHVSRPSVPITHFPPIKLVHMLTYTKRKTHMHFFFLLVHTLCHQASAASLLDKMFLISFDRNKLVNSHTN